MRPWKRKRKHKKIEKIEKKVKKPSFLCFNCGETTCFIRKMDVIKGKLMYWDMCLKCRSESKKRDYKVEV